MTFYEKTKTFEDIKNHGGGNKTDIWGFRIKYKGRNHALSGQDKPGKYILGIL